MSYTPRLAEFSELIRSVPIRIVVEGAYILMVAGILAEVHSLGSEVVLRASEDNGVFCILFEGDRWVDEKGSEGSRSNRKGDHFGQEALLNDTPQTGTVQCFSESAMVLALDKQSFESLGPLWG